MGSQGHRWRKQLVVHFNRLKPCNDGVPPHQWIWNWACGSRKSTYWAGAQWWRGSGFGEIVILPDTDQHLSSPDQDVPAQVPEEAARGGSIWSSRFAGQSNHQIIISQLTPFHKGGSSVMNTMDMCFTQGVLWWTQWICVVHVTYCLYSYCLCTLNNHSIVYLGSINTQSVLCMLVLFAIFQCYILLLLCYFQKSIFLKPLQW